MMDYLHNQEDIYIDLGDFDSHILHWGHMMSICMHQYNFLSGMLLFAGIHHVCNIVGGLELNFHRIFTIHIFTQKIIKNNLWFSKYLQWISLKKFRSKNYLVYIAHWYQALILQDKHMPLIVLAENQQQHIAERYCKDCFLCKDFDRLLECKQA